MPSAAEEVSGAPFLGTTSSANAETHDEDREVVRRGPPGLDSPVRVPSSGVASLTFPKQAADAPLGLFDKFEPAKLPPPSSSGSNKMPTDEYMRKARLAAEFSADLPTSSLAPPPGLESSAKSTPKPFLPLPPQGGEVFSYGPNGSPKRQGPALSWLQAPAQTRGFAARRARSDESPRKAFPPPPMWLEEQAEDEEDDAEKAAWAALEEEGSAPASKQASPAPPVLSYGPHGSPKRAQKRPADPRILPYADAETIDPWMHGMHMGMGMHGMHMGMGMGFGMPNPFEPAFPVPPPFPGQQRAPGTEIFSYGPHGSPKRTSRSIGAFPPAAPFGDLSAASWAPLQPAAFGAAGYSAAAAAVPAARTGGLSPRSTGRALAERLMRQRARDAEMPQMVSTTQ